MTQLEILRKMEWSGFAGMNCIICGRFKPDGHQDTCLLAQAIAEAEKDYRQPWCPCGGEFMGVGIHVCSQHYVYDCNKCGCQISIPKQLVTLPGRAAEAEKVCEWEWVGTWARSCGPAFSVPLKTPYAYCPDCGHRIREVKE